MPPSLGTWAWTERTGGRLRWRDRLALSAQAVLALAAARRDRRCPERLRHIEVNDIIPPDSAICRAAIALSAEASPPFLYNHCLRAYFWAVLLNGDRPFDAEALFTAVMLHDLGLTERRRLPPAEHGCFTLPAARIANALALDHGWTNRRARSVADAICLHLNVVVAARHGREAELVRIGSGADVAGLGMRRIPPDQRDEVIHRYPRLDMKREIDAVLSADACRNAACRIGFLYDRLGFGDRIRKTRAFAE